ncbi:MAG: ribbon-helix-helix domain-containing protein [Chloroflexota bacterium]
MKVKTSITLSEELLPTVDELARQFKNRSEFIEAAVRAFIAALAHNERDARELDLINRHADWLNQEAEDVLAYQVEL